MVLKLLYWQDGGNQPNFVSQLTTKQGPYTHEEILAILATAEWTQPIEE